MSWWGLLDEEGWSVRAAPLAHTAPCVGFVVEEAGKPGRLMPEVAAPLTPSVGLTRSLTRSLARSLARALALTLTLDRTPDP